jgi:hypothetical protein
LAILPKFIEETGAVANEAGVVVTWGIALAWITTLVVTAEVDVGAGAMVCSPFT